MESRSNSTAPAWAPRCVLAPGPRWTWLMPDRLGETSEARTATACTSACNWPTEGAVGRVKPVSGDALARVSPALRVVYGLLTLPVEERNVRMRSEGRIPGGHAGYAEKEETRPRPGISSTRAGDHAA